MLLEKKLLKDKEIAGDNGINVLLEAQNRATESLYQLGDNNVTIEDNLAMQLWTASWHGTVYPNKKIDTNRIKGLPKGLIVLAATENGTAYSMGNPAWTFERDTVKITDINGIVSTNDYTATFLIL